MNSSISGKGIRQHLENQIKNQIALNSRTVAHDVCKLHSCTMYIFHSTRVPAICLYSTTRVPTIFHYTCSNYLVVYIPQHVFKLLSCLYSTTRVPTTLLYNLYIPLHVFQLLNCIYSTTHVPTIFR